MENIIENINLQFINFVKEYDLKDSNISRKIFHTQVVANACFQIACKLELNESDTNLAYVGGILHDIGRFEQWKLYKTYSDKQSVDHAEISRTGTKIF